MRNKKLGRTYFDLILREWMRFLLYIHVFVSVYISMPIYISITMSKPAYISLYIHLHGFSYLSVSMSVSVPFNYIYIYISVSVIVNTPLLTTYMYTYIWEHCIVTVSWICRKCPALLLMKQHVGHPWGLSTQFIVDE